MRLPLASKRGDSPNTAGCSKNGVLIAPQTAFNRAVFANAHEAKKQRLPIEAEPIRRTVRTFIQARKRKASSLVFPHILAPLVVRRTFLLSLEGKHIPVQMEINRRDNGALLGCLTSQEFSPQAFSWSPDRPIPTAFNPPYQKHLEAVAHALARELVQDNRYSRKADEQPSERNIPHVRRPSRNRRAAVINPELANPIALICLQTEAEMWNRVMPLAQWPENIEEEGGEKGQSMMNLGFAQAEQPAI